MNRFKRIGMVLLTVALSIAVTGHALAWRGPGGGGRGAETGIPACPFLEGTPITIEGVVSEIAFAGQGLGIDTEHEVVTVYGVGSFRYWNELGVDRPEVGEAIIVDARVVTFTDGTVKAIAVTIYLGDDVVELRNPETGAPLWRGSGGRRF